MFSSFRVYFPQRTTYSKLRKAIFLEKGGCKIFALTHVFQLGPWSRKVTIVLGHSFVFVNSTNMRTGTELTEI